MGGEQLSPLRVLGRVEHLGDPLVRRVYLQRSHHGAGEDLRMLQGITHHVRPGEDPETGWTECAPHEIMLGAQPIDSLHVGQDRTGQKVVEIHYRIRSGPRLLLANSRHKDPLYRTSRTPSKNTSRAGYT